MRLKIVATNNYKAAASAFAAATAREAGLPGIILIHGESGRGKSVITAKLAVKLGAIFATAIPIWTPAWMLSTLCAELSLKATRRCAPMFEILKRELSLHPRAIVLDEADCIADRKELTETLRILIDLTAVSLVLVGMQEFCQKAMRTPQLERRILREVAFKASTLEDSRLIAAELAEVRVADDLIEALHRRSRGSAGLFVKELAGLEGWCRRRGLNKVALADYPMEDSAAPPAKRADLAVAA
ncbi:MAG: ATP-binding protein [Candidatus Binataceae bacterium]